MSVAKVRVVSIIGMLEDLDKVVKICGKSESFQPEEAKSFYSNMKGFSAISEKNPYTMLMQIMNDTMRSSNISPEFVDIEEFKVDVKEINDYVESMSAKIGALISKRNEIMQSIEETKKSISEIQHFTGLNLNFKEIFSCKFIKVRFGRLPKESYLKLGSYSDNPYILFSPCTSDNTHYWGVYFSPIEKVTEVDRIFGGLYFERLWVPSIEGTPEEKLHSLKIKINELREEHQVINRKIDLFWRAQKDQCMRFYTKLYELKTYFEIKKYAWKYKNSFILVGWIPESFEEEFSQCLDVVDGIEYSIESAETRLKHSPPVKLKNNKLVKPFELFVKMYGLPSYGEIDPTPFVAITYIVLFGIMFGDLGQGIIISVVGYFMWKLKKNELGRILIRCGVMSSIFGVIYGSFFGFEHALDPIYKMVLGLHEKPVEVMETNTTNLIIYLSVAIGIVLVMVAMMINIYSSLKQKNFENGLFGQNGVAGLIFYISIVMMIASPIVFGFDVMSPLYLCFCILTPILIIFLREPLGKLAKKDPNWKPPKWGEFIVQNVFEMFEMVLSYATNTMSFLRVGSFVLVHVGMMTVVFTLAQMCPGIGYWIVVVIGNIFVMGLEGLLVGIQVLRLEFYEMFSRFFDGQGRPFKPVKVDSFS